MKIPGDPVMLLSFLNTQLRDNFSDLSDLCAYFDIEEHAICRILMAIDYAYDPDVNQFV